MPSPAPAAPSRLVAAAARRSSAQQVGRPGPAPHPPPLPVLAWGPWQGWGTEPPPSPRPAVPPVPPTPPRPVPPAPPNPPVPAPSGAAAGGGGCPSAGPSVPAGGGVGARVGGRSLARGDTLRNPHPRPRSGWGRWGSRPGAVGGAGSRGQGRGGTGPPRAGPYYRAGALFWTPWDRVEGDSERGVGWSGRWAPSLVLWRVSPRPPTGVSGGEGRGLCLAGCVVAPWGVRGNRLWVLWGRLGWGTVRRLSQTPLPPGGGGSRGRQRGSGGDAKVLQTRVCCEPGWAGLG